ncbi:hypothetical protein Acr_06g0008310 [Actinidia rufa]|uniref:Uncharacterized protein n=1 Tax=Actinidia rufa TaxID=165716 RepID=A0A7J0EQX6_9ERIC|nr:hypothetical protein Acr_06g0008310 [Actinidia rufa]
MLKSKGEMRKPCMKRSKSMRKFTWRGVSNVWSVPIARRLGKIVEKHGQYIDRIWDLYENLYEQHTAFNQQHTHQMAEMEARLEGLWVHLVPPPPPPPFALGEAPPRPPYQAPPY